MRPPVRWLITREGLIAVCAGLVAPLLWTSLESQLAYYIHLPLSQWLIGEPAGSKTAYWWLWRSNQLVYGLLSAVLFAVPLSLAFRRDRLGYGVLFVATFLVSLVGGMLVSGGGEHIPTLFSLPDTWSVLGGCLVVFWLMQRRQMNVLPSNNAMDSDTVHSPLRAPHGARHRER